MVLVLGYDADRVVAGKVPKKQFNVLVGLYYAFAFYVEAQPPSAHQYHQLQLGRRTLFSRAECRVLFVSVWSTQLHYRLFGGIDDKVQEIPTICIEN